MRSIWTRQRFLSLPGSATSFHHHQSLWQSPFGTRTIGAKQVKMPFRSELEAVSAESLDERTEAKHSKRRTTQFIRSHNISLETHLQFYINRCEPKIIWQIDFFSITMNHVLTEIRPTSTQIAGERPNECVIISEFEKWAFTISSKSPDWFSDC